MVTLYLIRHDVREFPMTFEILIGIVLTAGALSVVVFLAFWSRHIIERIYAHPPGSLREIQKEIKNGNES
jgi:hypothetical protein